MVKERKQARIFILGLCEKYHCDLDDLQFMCERGEISLLKSNRLQLKKMLIEKNHECLRISCSHCGYTDDYLKSDLKKNINVCCHGCGLRFVSIEKRINEDD